MPLQSVKATSSLVDSAFSWKLTQDSGLNCTLQKQTNQITTTTTPEILLSLQIRQQFRKAAHTLYLLYRELLQKSQNAQLA